MSGVRVVQFVLCHRVLAPTFKPGQWVDFHIPGVKQIGGFSITSSPQQLAHDKTLDLAIKRASYPPARWVHEQVGDPKNQLQLMRMPLSRLRHEHLEPQNKATDSLLSCCLCLWQLAT